MSVRPSVRLSVCLSVCPPVSLLWVRTQKQRRVKTKLIPRQLYMYITGMPILGTEVNLVKVKVGVKEFRSAAG